VNGTNLESGNNYNVIEDDMITGNIITILEGAWDALRPHLARTKFQPNALFRESIIYPEEACRETLINAVSHRDYSIEGKPIEFLIFDDRMEVWSPGRLLSTIMIKDLKELKGTHQSRNVFVARVLRELGYMREMGEGIRRIFSSVRTFELVDPEISSDQNSFVVTLFHKSIFSPKDVQWLNGFSDFFLSKDEQRVVLLGRDGRLLSTEAIIETLGIVDTEDFRALYERLHRKGIIFSAKPATAKHRKRSIPRFQIRPPQEAQQYLAELQKALFEVGPVQKLSGLNVVKSLRDRLSPNSPYKTEPVFCLRALGYISETFAPLPRATVIWNRGSETSISRSTSVATPTPPTLETPIEKGVVKYLVPDRGFGFIQVEGGERFYMHVYQLLNKTDWDRLSLGSEVTFQAGERSIPGKEKSAKLISLL